MVSNKLGMKQRKRVSTAVYHTFMIIFSFVMIYPLIWMLASSFKPNTEIFKTVESLIPKEFTIQHYIDGWKGFAGFSFAGFYKNTVFIALMSTIGNVLSNVIVAYGFARLRFPGRGFWFAVMMLTMMLPGQVLMIPQFLLFNEMNWVGTFLPLFVPSFFGSAFNVFMVMQFIRGIPKEMDEAARIDGCSWYGVFSKIHIPLIKPVISTIAVMSFMGAWSDFMGPLLYLNSPEQYTVAYALKLFNDSAGNDYGATFAMSVLSMVPILVLFFIFQKQLIEGISIDGIKG